MPELFSATDYTPSRQIVLLAKQPRFGVRPQDILLKAAKLLHRQSAAFRSGMVFMSLSAAAGMAHALASKHGFDIGTDQWGRAAYLGAYMAAWLAFLIASSRSIVFGLVIGCAYMIAERYDLASSGQVETLLLLMVTAIATRVLCALLQAMLTGFGTTPLPSDYWHPAEA